MQHATLPLLRSTPSSFHAFTRCLCDAHSTFMHTLLTVLGTNLSSCPDTCPLSFPHPSCPASPALSEHSTHHSPVIRRVSRVSMAGHHALSRRVSMAPSSALAMDQALHAEGSGMGVVDGGAGGGLPRQVERTFSRRAGREALEVAVAMPVPPWVGRGGLRGIGEEGMERAGATSVDKDRGVGKRLRLTQQSCTVAVGRHQGIVFVPCVHLVQTVMHVHARCQPAHVCTRSCVCARLVPACAPAATCWPQRVRPPPTWSVWRTSLTMSCVHCSSECCTHPQPPSSGNRARAVGVVVVVAACCVSLLRNGSLKCVCHAWHTPSSTLTSVRSGVFAGMSSVSVHVSVV